MTAILKKLHEERMALYRRYLAKEFNHREYLKRIKPLDLAVEKLEMSIFSRKALSRKRS